MQRTRTRASVNSRPARPLPRTCPPLPFAGTRGWPDPETWVGSGQDASASQICKQMLGEAAAGLPDYRHPVAPG